MLHDSLEGCSRERAAQLLALAEGDPVVATALHRQLSSFETGMQPELAAEIPQEAGAPAETELRPAIVTQPLEDVEIRDHMNLGISLEGAVRFLQHQLGLNPDGSAFGSNESCSVQNVRERYASRDCQHEYNWISLEYPDHLTGYDLIQCIKQWLRQQGAADKSVCEVLLERGNNWDLLGGTNPGRKPPVGQAEIFLSHVQAEPPLDTLCLMRKIDHGHAGVSSKCFQWLDYFSLRQCQSDFKAPEIVKLISEIGHTAVNMDKKRQVWERSFCVLETYATVRAGAGLSVRHVHVGDPAMLMAGAGGRDFVACCCGAFVGPTGIGVCCAGFGTFVIGGGGGAFPVYPTVCFTVPTGAGLGMCLGCLGLSWHNAQALQPPTFDAANTKCRSPRDKAEIEEWIQTDATLPRGFETLNQVRQLLRLLGLPRPAMFVLPAQVMKRGVTRALRREQLRQCLVEKDGECPSPCPCDQSCPSPCHYVTGLLNVLCPAACLPSCCYREMQRNWW